MNTFERNADPKKSLNIGKIANPVKIHAMYTMSVTEGPDMVISEGSANMTIKSTRKILDAISKGELWGDSWKTRYLVGVYTGKEKILPNGGKNLIFTINPINDFLGCYIEFEGIKYHIKP